ncbi:MAG: DUF1002 domain-containing protein [Lachnospiraceae bacterium]|nr:DUF1002 domain-containing protein [Lachnospiraceae bacterium]
MKKMYLIKKFGALCLAGILAFSAVPQGALATEEDEVSFDTTGEDEEKLSVISANEDDEEMDIATEDAEEEADEESEEAAEEKPYLALGADLSEKEMATVLKLLGIEKEEVANYQAVQITNDEEHEYLDKYLDASVIGSRALSSVLVQKEEEGHGIEVETHNINYCSEGMYTNALVTAGIEDAKVIVAGPFEISGTSALVGAMKAYSEITGEEISEDAMDAALNELVVTSELAEDVDPESMEKLMAFVKQKLAENNLDSEEEILAAIEEGEKEFDVKLSDEEKQKIVDLMTKISALDIDLDSLLSQADSIYDGIAKLQESAGVLSKVADFFSGIADSIAGFFGGLFG